MVLCMLSYVNLGEAIPKQGKVRLAQAAESYFRKKGVTDILRQREDEVSLSECETLFWNMAKTERFRNVILSDYCEKNDEETQFAAVRADLDDGTSYIAFRGTDDTIAGWREDFAISYRITPAQEEAVKYLENSITEKTGAYRIGGHSKGGNLAMYASMMCSEVKKQQIIEIYNNDGPGICRELKNTEQFEQIRKRIIRYIPGFSIIGKLFEEEVRTYVVASSAEGILQHDGLTWKVEGDHFVPEKEISPKCRAYNQIFDTWIEQASMEQREIFTRDFFHALEANGAKRTGELSEGGLDGYGTILIALAESESRTKVVIGKLIASFWQYLKSLDIREVLRSKQGIQGMIWMGIGVLLLVFPNIAVQGIGGACAFAGFLWSGRRLEKTAMENVAEDYPEEKTRKRRMLLFYLLFLCLMVVLMCCYRVVIVSLNLAVGALLVAYAFQKTRMVFQKTEMGKGARVAWIIVSVLAFLLGIVALATPGQIFVEKVLTVGSFLVLYGAGKICFEMFRQCREKR